MPDRFNGLVRRVLLAGRWAMAPLCLGLVVALLIEIAQFFRELYHAVIDFPGMGDAAVILAVLKLVDLMLVANLVLMLIGAAVEIFAPSPASARDERDGTAMADFAALKPKLFASIAAIAGIDLLESFINIEVVDKTTLLWEIVIMLTFVVAGVLLALMDRLGEGRR
jgi:uncharacterized protein (TIGR00645 family)